MRNRILVAALLVVPLLALAWAMAQPPKAGDDEQAIRKAIESYAAAFNRGDLDALLAHWAPDADFTDESGQTYRGRDAIATLFKKHLASLKGHKLVLNVKSIRLIRPDVALQDGSVELIAPDGASETGRAHAVWIKGKDRWLLSSVRDLPGPAEAAASPGQRLKELEWLIGDWVGEQGAVTVTLSCRWAPGRSFLVQEYAIKGKEDGDLTVTKWVGWDPINGKLRSWLFDSRGGYGDGFWTRQGNTWTVAAEGVVSDGRVGSATNSIKHIDEKTFLWRTTDRELGGQPLTDAEVRFTRKTAKP